MRSSCCIEYIVLCFYICNDAFLVGAGAFYARAGCSCDVDVVASLDATTAEIANVAAASNDAFVV